MKGYYLMKNDASEWAAETFRESELGDPRRRNRLIQLASNYAEQIGSSTVECCNGDSAQIEGAYRFLRNDEIKPEAIREGGFSSTARKLKQEGTLLALEDTTTISYKHKIAEDLGYTSNSTLAKSRGFQVHSVLMVSQSSKQTIGLIDQSWYCRDNSNYGKTKFRKQIDYQDKESYKWENASRNVARRLKDKINDVISVCDREADIYDYLHYKLSQGQRFIVRARGNRNLASSEDKLYEEIFSKSPWGTYKIPIKQRGGRKARTATIKYYSGTVLIELPKHQRNKGLPDKLKLNVVAGKEIKNESSEENLQWIILTSEPVDSREAARQVLSNYEIRWRIEDFHKAWKSGVGVEKLRLQSKENLERCGSILAFIAVRLLQIKELGLLLPNKSKKSVLAGEILDKDEWKVLWMATNKSKPPKQAPTLEWVYQSLGKLGGWYDSKRTGIIGWKALWKGWFRLADKIETYNDAILYLRSDL